VPDRSLVDADLVTRRLRVVDKDVVYVKAIMEASEGIGALFAERGGDLLLAAPHSRRAALDQLLDDLCDELGVELDDEAAP
jgi:hypothetical protein